MTELKTQVLERLLEALSPTLAVELDRIFSEIYEMLEDDFKKRLQAAVQEGEAAAQAAEEKHQRSLADANQVIREQVAHDLNLEFKKTLDQKDQVQAEWSAERAHLQEQIEQWRTFAEAQQQLAQASSQAEILVRFLRLAEPFATDLAVYVAKNDAFSLWKSRGVAVFPPAISEETPGSNFYFSIITVRGKRLAAVCASPPYKAEALDFLVGSLERAVELFGLRLRAPMSKPNAAETTVPKSS